MRIKCNPLTVRTRTLLHKHWVGGFRGEGIPPPFHAPHGIDCILIQLFYSVLDNNLIVVIICFPPQSLTDDGIKPVCENCKKLERLSISNCEGLTDATLRKLGSSCFELRLLEAVGCSHFTDAGFKALANVSEEGGGRPWRGGERGEKGGGGRMEGGEEDL